MRSDRVLIVMLLALNACSVSVNSGHDFSSVERASVAYENAVRRQDVDAAAAFLADSVMIMPADAPTITGRATYSSFMRNMRGQIKLIDYRVTNRQFEGGAELAVETGMYRQTIQFGTMPERSFDTRYVYVWQRTRSDRWQISRAIFNHTAPLGR